MSHLNTLEPTFTLSPTGFLQCNSSSGAGGFPDKREQLTFNQIALAIKISEKKLSMSEYTNLICAENHLMVEPKTFKLIEGTFCFFKGATHTIVAEGKEGKTTFTIDELGKTSMSIVVLDGDSNSTSAIARAGENTKWIQPTDPDGLVDFYLSVVEKGIDASDHIFVIDSLQNFTDGRDLDSNNGMKEIILRLKKLTHTGATLVILHHVTATDDPKKPFKAKGNSGVLYSSSDVVYGFNRKTGLTAIKSRIDGINNGQLLGYGNIKHKDKTEAAIAMLDGKK